MQISYIDPQKKSLKLGLLWSHSFQADSPVLNDFHSFFPASKQKNNQEKKRKLTLELIEPPSNTIKGGAAADIIHHECPHSASIVGRSNCPEALLAGSVPYLSLDLLSIDLHALRLKLHPNRGLGVDIKLVASISREQVRFPHRRISNDHHFEQILLSFFVLHY